MNMYESQQFEEDIYCKLQEAEKEAASTDKRYSSEDVLQAVKEAIQG